MRGGWEVGVWVGGTGSCQDWDNELFVISCHHMALISFTSVGTIYLSFARWLPTSSRSNTVCGDVWFYLIPLLGNVGGLNDTIRIWTFASLNLRPNLGAYQGDGLITLTDFRYLTVLDMQGWREVLSRARFWTLQGWLVVLSRARLGAAQQFVHRPQSPPVQTFPRHQLQLIQNTSPLQVFTKLQYLLHQTDLLQNLDRRAIY